MTNQEPDHREEAEFEEFLQGRGELVKQLKALSQMSPSAALDAAIIASAKAAVAQAQRSKLAAANDPITAQNPNKSGTSTRFRMPMAMAASVMVAVLVGIFWHQTGDELPTQLAQAPETAPTTAAPQQAEAQVAATANAKMAQADTSAKAKSLSDNTSKSPTPAAPAPVAPARAVAAAPVAPPPTSQATAAAAPATLAKPAAPAPEARMLTSDKKADAPVVASTGVANDSLKRSAEPAPPHVAQQTEQVNSNARAKMAAAEEKTAGAPASLASNLVPATPTAAPSSVAGNVAAKEMSKAAVPAAAPANALTMSTASDAAKAEPTAADKAKAWLAAIEEMSKYDTRREAAISQLDRFEKSYPYYPVPEALKAKLKASKN
jgi:hypothetical protein